MFQRALLNSRRLGRTAYQRAVTQRPSPTTGAGVRQYANVVDKSTFRSSHFVMQALNSPQANQAKNIGLWLIGALALMAFMNETYKSNVQSLIIDESVLKNDDHDDSSLNVFCSLTLKVEDRKTTIGRSAGHKVTHKGEDEVHRHYYYKAPFDRSGLLNELVVGALGRLLDDEFPRVRAVETSTNDLNDRSIYGFISESLGEPAGNTNLESWATDHHKGIANNTPRNLGVAIAFDMLVGKSDCKLANIVMQSVNGHTYPIDNESAFNDQATFLAHANQGLRYLGEFRGKTTAEHALEAASDGVIDTKQDNRFQPLKGNEQVKFSIAPVIIDSISKDIEEKNVIRLYEKFASLSEADLNTIFDQYGCLIKVDERKHYLNELQERQAQTKEFLLAYKNSQALEEQTTASFSPGRKR